MSQTESDHTKKPIACFVLDVLLGSGVVLFILSVLYACANFQRGLPTYVIWMSACYAFLLLGFAVAITGPRKSTYGTPLLSNYWSLGIRCLSVAGLLMLGIGMVLFCTEWSLYRGVLCGFSVVALLSMIACLLLVKGLSSAMSRQARHPELTGCAVLFIGSRNKADHYRDSIPENERKGLRFFYFDPDTSEGPADSALQKVIEDGFIEKAVFVNGASHDKLVERCLRQGIEVWTPPSDPETGFQLCRFDVKKTAPRFSLMKFAFDRFAALMLILLSSPLWIIVAIGIRMADKGPVFYQQSRSGLYGKHFGMWKFRTMYTDAEKRLDEVKAMYGNDMDGPIFKLHNDPRIFKFGRFLRKFSIDELPQLINVLLGDMSMVGPRPLPVYETEAFEKIDHRKRLCVLPGLTCYWQIEGRSNITEFDELIALDDKYIDNFSFWLDIKLILRTVPAVLLARGAK